MDLCWQSTSVLNITYICLQIVSSTEPRLPLQFWVPACYTFPWTWGLFKALQSADRHTSVFWICHQRHLVNHSFLYRSDSGQGCPEPWWEAEREGKFQPDFSFRFPGVMTSCIPSEESVPLLRAGAQAGSTKTARKPGKVPQPLELQFVKSRCYYRLKSGNCKEEAATCWETGKLGWKLGPSASHWAPGPSSTDSTTMTQKLPFLPPGYEHLIKHLLYMPLSYLPGLRPFDWPSMCKRLRAELASQQCLPIGTLPSEKAVPDARGCASGGWKVRVDFMLTVKCLANMATHLHPCPITRILQH